MQVKIFIGDAGQVEKKLNDWIAKNSQQVEAESLGKGIFEPSFQLTALGSHSVIVLAVHTYKNAVD